MRMFAALAVPAEIRAAVEPLLPDLTGGLRRIPSSRWHLTLAFYGDASQQATDCLEARLDRRLVGSGALQLQVSGGGRFATVAFLAVAAVRPSHDDRLRELAYSCHRAGETCNTPGTAGHFRFRPHITVARARDGQVPGQYVQHLAQVSSQPWQATRVQLLTSTGGPTPAYQVRRTFPLPDR